MSQLNAQAHKDFRSKWPSGYILTNVNDEVGPGIVADFDADGKKDVACIIFEKVNGTPIFFLYLTSKGNVARYCDWEYFIHDMNYRNGILDVASNTGSMGIYGSMKLKYDANKQDMTVIRTAGIKGLKFKIWNIR